ncbi:MAG TPA: hypothetical protein VKV17_11285 [Bryobacteraceae bacterium]|nr:hypothetical protein [Bryobacteraceae bacterium]
MNNRVMEGTGYVQSVVVTNPSNPQSGWPVRFGPFTGVAATNTGVYGNQPTQTSVDFGPGSYQLYVMGANQNGNVAVNAGDPLYFVDNQVNGNGVPVLSKNSSGYLFGIALGSVASGATSLINVEHLPGVDPGQSNLLGINFPVIVQTNGTTPVNVFSANGAPTSLTLVSAFIISLDTNAGNISLTNAGNTVFTAAKGTTAGLSVPSGALANTSFALGAAAQVVSSGGNALVVMIFQH